MTVTILRMYANIFLTVCHESWIHVISLRRRVITNTRTYIVWNKNKYTNKFWYNLIPLKPLLYDISKNMYQANLEDLPTPGCFVAVTGLWGEDFANGCHLFCALATNDCIGGIGLFWGTKEGFAGGLDRNRSRTPRDLCPVEVLAEDWLYSAFVSGYWNLDNCCPDEVCILGFVEKVLQWL